jgi:hypothetical protein
MARQIAQRRIGQWHAGAGASEHQSPSAHIAAADEFLWKEQPVPEDTEYRLQVFHCRDTS